MCFAERLAIAAAVLSACLMHAGCENESYPTGGNSATRETLPPPTPAAVLARLTELGGQYQLDRHGRVWALSFHRCPLGDGDLAILRSLPGIRTMTLRGVSVVGGTLTLEGLRPIATLHELRRLDLSMNYRLTGPLDAVASLPKLDFLDLKGTEFGDEAMAAVATLPRLRTLRLGHMRLTDRGLKELWGSSIEQFEYWLRGDQDVALLGGMKNLRRWFIGYGNVPVDRLDAFAGADRLQEITLVCQGPTCPRESLDAIRTLRSLRTLEIWGSADDEWPILGVLNGLPELKALRLVSIGDAALEQLPALKSLEVLDLALSSAGTEAGLQRLALQPRLRHLSLNPDTTTPDGLAVVSECSQLQTLVFRANHIGEFLHQIYRAHAEFQPQFTPEDLRPVLEKTALTTLRVDRLGFGDELMTEVALAGSLRELGLSELHISDAGLETLRDLKYLTLLDIVGTDITYEAAQSLHTNYLPQCKITDNWCCGCMAIEPREPSQDE